MHLYKAALSKFDLSDIDVSTHKNSLEWGEYITSYKLLTADERSV